VLFCRSIATRLCIQTYTVALLPAKGWADYVCVCVMQQYMYCFVRLSCEQ
jgi:hypothetical protein